MKKCAKINVFCEIYSNRHVVFRIFDIFDLFKLLFYLRGKGLEIYIYKTIKNWSGLTPKNSYMSDHKHIT